MVVIINNESPLTKEHLAKLQAEAMALNLADNADAKMQTLKEIFKDKKAGEWLGYNRLFESNLRKTTI